MLTFFLKRREEKEGKKKIFEKKCASGVTTIQYHPQKK